MSVGRALTATERLAALGLTHREPTADERSAYRVQVGVMWPLYAQVIEDADGERVAILRADQVGKWLLRRAQR